MKKLLMGLFCAFLLATVSSAFARGTKKSQKRPIPASTVRHALSGTASYYWKPQPTASGRYFNPNEMTAAHRTLPFGTKVLVKNLKNGREAIFTITDRGPYVRGRIIDVSKAGARKLGMIKSGLAKVQVFILPKTTPEFWERIKEETRTASPKRYSNEVFAERPEPITDEWFYNRPAWYEKCKIPRIN